ncbi:MAG: hypothetical protein AAGB19_16225, partial [Cyanobacteria bacterium P01_F01_bin.3]
KAEKPDKDQKATDRFPPEGKGVSPYHPNQLLNIFAAPGAFFSAEIALGKPINVWIATWLLGFATAFSNINRSVVSFKRGESSLEPPSEVLYSWSDLWMGLLLAGFVFGILLWLFGGWWFHIRVLLSGAPEPDGQVARLVYIYSALVRSLPAFVTLIVWSILYQNLDDAYTQGGLFVSQFLSIIFLFGELITAYIGVKTLYSVDQPRAMVWFIFAPAAWYTVSIGQTILSYFYL